MFSAHCKIQNAIAEVKYLGEETAMADLFIRAPHGFLR
jgi:hypothetical protein